MKTIFLSYASQDYFFAEMLAIKLEAAGRFRLWRDLGAIRAGNDWRQAIEQGIGVSDAVVVAVSEASAASPYVTFEWAYALGLRRPVVPVKLALCAVHPRLEVIQHFDFSYPRALPWDELIKRLDEVEPEADAADDEPAAAVAGAPGKRPRAGAPSSALRADARTEEAQAVRDILGYLDRHGFTMASFERLQQRVVKGLGAAQIEALVDRHPDLFRHARLKGGKPGLAKRVP